MAAPVLASIGSRVANSTSTIAPPVPSGVVSGSLVCVFIFGAWGASPTVSSAVTPPTGFALGGSVVYPDTDDNVNVAAIWYYKYATGSDTGTYSFTANSVSGGAILAGGGVAVRITGGPASGNPFVDAFKSATRSTSGTSVTISTFTPGGNDSLLLAAMINDTTSTLTFPSGWTISGQGTDTNGNTAGIGYRAQTGSPVATGSLAFTASVAAHPAALIGTIRPAQTNARVGSATPSGYRVGSGTVSKIYLGSTVIWG